MHTETIEIKNSSNVSRMISQVNAEISKSHFRQRKWKLKDIQNYGQKTFFVYTVT